VILVFFPSCLDWSKIYGGEIGCRNDNFDEEHCWQLEINECNDDDYRYPNGQCIPKSFYLDDFDTPDCLDQSDEYQRRQNLYENQGEPSFICEDVTSISDGLTSFCLKQRPELLVQALYPLQDKSFSNKCWLAFKCATQMPYSDDPIYDNICKNKIYINMTDQTCPDLVFMPTIPILFNDICFAYT